MASPARLGLMAVLILTGCTGEVEEWGGHVEDVDGVTRIRNPVSPLAGPGEITAQLLWSSSGPVEGDYWEAPNRVHAHEGVVYVVDRQASKIHRMSSGGELLPSLGDAGGGPGQYGRIIDALPTSAGLFVVDGGNARVEILSPEGDLMASSPLGQIVFSVAPFGDDAVAVWGILGREELWQKIDADASLTDLAFPDFIDPDTSGIVPSRAGSWDGAPARLRLTHPRIQVFSPAGELTEVIDIALPVEEATDAEIEAEVEEITSVLSERGFPGPVIQQQVDRVRSRPRAKKRFGDFRFDDGSGLAGIWEQNPEDFGSGPASLHILSTHGIYLGVLAFDRSWSAFDLVDGVLYALTREPDTGLITLRAYSISVPAAILVRARELAAGGGR